MPRKPKARKSDRPVATLDFETDPFLYGREPKPFCAGLYSLESGYREFWGADCVARVCEFMATLSEPHVIYAHNGGKFDFHLMLDFLENPIMLINGRIAKVALGQHELRDSYCILPIPLRLYQKLDIDYRKLEAEVRDQHREEISKYLHMDCVSLFELVTKFIERFGMQLTIGGAAIKKLREFHPFDTRNRAHDTRFRPFYFGGRVEAMKTGIYKGNWKVFDVNSMYPHVMRDYAHPCGGRYMVGYNRIIDKRGRVAGFADAAFYFARIRCDWQRGAFPVRVKNEPLNFDTPGGEYWVTSHELQAAIDCGRVGKCVALEVYVPAEVIQFGEYVDTYMAEKIATKAIGDKAGEIFAKLLLNSAYGKTGQSPDKYHDYYLGDTPPDDSWHLHSGGIETQCIWAKKSESETFYDVAIAASVTGAARAVLMRALSKAINPIYCDTDSIICEGLAGVPLDGSKLGAWKLEATGSEIAVYGKKVYALRDSSGEYVKTASKGVQLEGPDIFALCRGEAKQWQNDAPSFSLGKKRVSFVKRKISGL